RKGHDDGYQSIPEGPEKARPDPARQAHRRGARHVAVGRAEDRHGPCAGAAAGRAAARPVPAARPARGGGGVSTFGKKPPARSVRSRKQRPDALEALRILAGCAQGATEAALAANGITRATLAQLVRQGKVRTWEERFHKPDITVRWYANA